MNVIRTFALAALVASLGLTATSVANASTSSQKSAQMSPGQQFLTASAYAVVQNSHPAAVPSSVARSFAGSAEGKNGNNIVCTGVPTKRELLRLANGGADKCGNRDIAAIWASMGITYAVAKTMHAGTACSDEGYMSSGRQHSPNPSLDKSRYAGDSHFYVRPLSVWGNTCYSAWIGTTEDGRKVAILMGCGNPETVKLPPRPMKTPAPRQAPSGNCNAINSPGAIVCSNIVIIVVCSNNTTIKITGTKNETVKQTKARAQKKASACNKQAPAPKPTPPAKTYTASAAKYVRAADGVTDVTAKYSTYWLPVVVRVNGTPVFTTWIRMNGTSYTLSTDGKAAHQFAANSTIQPCEILGAIRDSQGHTVGSLNLVPHASYVGADGCLTPQSANSNPRFVFVNRETPPQTTCKDTNSCPQTDCKDTNTCPQTCPDTQVWDDTVHKCIDKKTDGATPDPPVGPPSGGGGGQDTGPPPPPDCVPSASNNWCTGVGAGPGSTQSTRVTARDL